MMETFSLTKLDSHFAEFIVRIEGKACDGLWLAAALVSSVTCRGHVCLDLPAIAACGIPPLQRGSDSIAAPSIEVWLKSLAGCATVGRPGDYTPLVLDAAGRLYLHRSWDAERRVAEGIRTRCSLLVAEDSDIQTRLDAYFPPVADVIDLQREAAGAALRRQFTVISGGPGTGKTTTVARILALVVELSAHETPVIRAVAPTGKAALRLKQSLAHAAEQLPVSAAVRAALPREVTTIHRLLGVLPGRPKFRHNRDNRLSCDLLVVDEASMVDLPLMARLLEALPEQTRVILLGDRDQLASVEAGAVMADICAGAGPDKTPPEDVPAIVHLTKSHRFRDDSGIGRLSCLINAGDGLGALELLSSGECSEIVWRQLAPAANFADLFMASVAEGYADYALSNTPAEALVALDSFRVLAPHREGRHGVVRLNQLVESALTRLRPAGFATSLARAVMVTANDYELELFNGDTGVVMDEGDGDLRAAYFPLPESPELRRISTLRLPQHEAAFALTVHKAQGSEYDNVLLILPDQLSEVLCRELLYTAVTRARKSVEIWGVEDVFCRAVERRTERNSGLRDLLWDRGAL